MHDLSVVISPYIILIQMGIIIGLANALAEIPAFKRVGLPAVSMGLTLVICSIIPKFLPDAYHSVVPETPAWPFFVAALLIPILGGYAGDEINPHEMRHMGRKGALFVVTSMVAPILLALPVAFGLVMWKGNPYTQLQADSAGVVMGIIAVIFMRALPTMIAFFKSNNWENDLVKASLVGASFDDLFVFVVIQPVIAGIMSGNGLVGIVHSGSAVAVTGLGMYILARITRVLPGNFQLPMAMFALLTGAGLGEVFGHVHIILSGIFFGLFMPKNVTKELEHDTKKFAIKWLVPLFFAGLGITRQFDILAWQPWLLMAACFAAAYIAHEFITARVAAKLFGDNRTAGRILGALCRTHGTADVLLAVTLFDMGILSTHGLSGIVLYLMFATIQAFNQAQSLVDQNPELAAIRMPTLPLPEEDQTWVGVPVFASTPDNEDK